MVVFGLMLCGALAELLTLGAVVPFLALVSDVDAPNNYPALAWLLDLMGVTTRKGAIVSITAIFCTIVAVAASIRIFLAWASQKFVFRIGYDLGVALYQRMMYQPYSFHVSRNSSEIASAVFKIQLVLNQLMMPALQGIISIIIAIFILCGLLLISAKVALASIIAFGSIYLGISFFTRHRLRKNSKIVADANTQRLKTVQEGLGGIRDVLIDHSQLLYIAKFAKIEGEMRTAQATNALISALPKFAIEALGMIIIAVLALVLSAQPGGLVAALPVLGALAIGAQRLLPLLQQTYTGWAAMLSSRSSVFDVLSLLDQPMPSDHATQHKVKPLDFNRSLAVRKLNFRYAESEPLVLRDLDFEIPKGHCVGFIGKTGSGKSTVIDIIMGLLSPTTGTVEIDGKPLGQADIPAWQKQIAHVPQHIYLADATVLENIALGVPEDAIDEGRVIDAAKRANLHDFVGSLSEGYTTIVGERGARLSGGQRQRIGIARALYKRANVIVLDEATSALDDTTERSVMSSIAALSGGNTILMIAHRMSTLRFCDTIYRVENGQILEKGDYASMVG